MDLKPTIEKELEQKHAIRKFNSVKIYDIKTCIKICLN